MTAVRAVMASLQAAVEAGGGTALAVMLLAESLFPPIPSEVVLPLAGYAVHAGRMPFAVALAAATTGSVAGAWVPAGRFTALTAAGSAVWNAGLIGAGMLLGARWERATTMDITYARFALPAVAVAGCAALLHRGLRGRTDRRVPAREALAARLDRRPGGRR